jgi:general nucleoside transport system permease protein
VKQSWIIAFVLASIRAAMPLTIAAQGVLLSERAGVLNIGVEGEMLGGSLTGVLVAVVTGNVWLALLAAMAVGLLLGFLQGVFTVILPADQVVVGVAMNLTMLGATSFVYKLTIDHGVNLIAPATLEAVTTGLKGVPVLGVLASISPLAYFALLLTILMYLYLFWTGPGLLLRSMGESAYAADSAGLNVRKVRFVMTGISGMICALAGAALTLAWVRSFTDNVTLGRGFIALAAVYFGRWNPLLAAAACLLFGAGEALAFRAQALGAGLSPFYYLMLPYVLTIATVGFMGRQAGPHDAGKPYRRG